MIVVILSLALGTQVPGWGAAAAPAGAGGEESVTPMREHVHGQKLREEYLRRVVLTDNEALKAHVEEVGRRVAAHSDRPDLAWGFFVVVPAANEDRLQAFARNGGTISVTEPLAQLLGHAEAEDELAFVLAHEVAHVALRHTMDKKGYTRSQDLEADRYGALYAVRAGYAFSAGPESIRRLKLGRERANELGTFRTELEWALRAFDEGVASLDRGRPKEARVALGGFVQTFPQSLAGRINLGTACLAGIAERHGNPADLRQPWPVLREHGIRLRGAGDSALLDGAQRNFRQALALAPDSARARVGLSIVALHKGDGEAAQAEIDQIPMPVDPDRQAEWQLAHGNAEYVLEQWADAENRFRQALVARPGWVAARVNLAMTFEASGRAEEALPIWRSLGMSGR